MRKIIIEIEAGRHEVPLEWEEDTPLDRDSLYDYWIHEYVSQPEYTWKVLDEDGKDVTKEYDHDYEADDAS